SYVAPNLNRNGVDVGVGLGRLQHSEQVNTCTRSLAMASDLPEEPQLLVTTRDVQGVLRSNVVSGADRANTSRNAEAQQQPGDIFEQTPACRRVIDPAAGALPVDRDRTVGCPQVAEEQRD